MKTEKLLKKWENFLVFGICLSVVEIVVALIWIEKIIDEI